MRVVCLSLSALLWLLLGFPALYPQGQEGPTRDVQGMWFFCVLEVEPKAAQQGLCSYTSPSPNMARASHHGGG